MAQLILQTVVALCMLSTSQGQLAMTLDQSVIRSYRDTPYQCYFRPYPCGDLYKLDKAIDEIRTWLDTPPPPPFPKDRSISGDFVPDYRLCNSQHQSHTWISFPWSGRMQYLRLLDSLKFVRCPQGMCDSKVAFGGYKYGCVALWEHRTFNVLWQADPEYVNKETKCTNGWCLVRVRVQYPESCTCAQLYKLSNNQ